MDEHTENMRINWFVGVALAAGSSFLVLAFMGHHWADIALKVYWNARRSLSQ